jgi:hypothetical protein
MDTTLANQSAVVWLDRTHALVARAHEGRAEVTEVDRSFDGEPAYLLRVLHEAADCDRIVVMGTDAARVALEREYVALYRRPDRLVDIGQMSEPREADLVDQLRMLEPSLAATH